MLKGTGYNAGEWKQATSGSPKLTITKTDEPETTGSLNWNLYTWKDGENAKELRFKDRGDGTYYLVLEVSGTRGMLVRKYMNWNAGSKFGAAGNGKLTEGVPMDLVSEGADISFSGSGRYKVELTNVATETLYYMGCFSDWMPDLNYGDVSVAETNPCFLDLAASADKWINLGVDGFRLDAVKHICGGIGSFNHQSNRTLLKKWYEHCNATYKAAGHSDDIFMVAEEWDDHSTEKSYYQSLTSCFEFNYFGTLTAALNGNASSYVSTVSGYVSDHTAVRADAITSLFMSNHDQHRAAESLGRNAAKEKQAAAMLLTSPGKPFVYQGEELGYWGKKDNGDEYVRTPMLWDKAGKDCAKQGVNGKVDSGMLTSAISVESQSADASSLLNVYKTWSRLRNTYPALAEGTMTVAPGNGSTIAAWYMTSGNQKLLVIHNTASSEKKVTVTDNLSHPVALLGTATLDHDVLTLDKNTSVVFKL
jgi:glycosidase